MNVIDLSHPITPDMPVFPGTQPPVFESPVSIEVDGFREYRVTLFTHIGTHLDAPAHIVKDGPTLDDLPADRFIGPGLVVDARPRNGRLIQPGDLTPLADRLKGRDFLILRTGWSRRWGQSDYFDDFPVLSPEAARFVAGLGLKGLGVDAISLDPTDSRDYAVHHIILGSGMVAVENLTNLEKLPESGFIFIGLPLRFPAGDGSPLRAVAVIGQETGGTF